MSDFVNTISALPVPFSDGEIDAASFARLIRHQLDNGVTGLVINGTTGESPTVSDREGQRLFEIARAESGGRAKLIVGTGTNATSTTIEKTTQAEKWGADAALVVVPYYNKPPQRGLAAHFSAVARATDLPILIYNVPSRTGVAIDPTTVVGLALEKNITGIKDASADLSQLEELKKIRKTSFWLLSGDDTTGVEFCLRGGHGIISVISNLIPKPLSELIAAARAGRREAVDHYRKFDDLLRWLYAESNPIPLKWALKEMGIFRSAEMRLPLVEYSAEKVEGFRKCLRTLDLV